MDKDHINNQDGETDNFNPKSTHTMYDFIPFYINKKMYI